MTEAGTRPPGRLPYVRFGSALHPARLGLGTERLINRLIELGKPFDVMVYPNRTHAIAEGPGATAHLYHRIARYFLDNLPPSP